MTYTTGHHQDEEFWGFAFWELSGCPSLYIVYDVYQINSSKINVMTESLPKNWVQFSGSCPFTKPYLLKVLVAKHKEFT